MQQNLQNIQSSSSKNQSNEKQLYEGRWTPQEHIEFLKAILMYGKDWKKVEEVIPSRTGSQVRSHAQKFFLKINKINKQRRRHKNKPFQLSETQTQILKLFTEQDITQNSPTEMISIIRKEFTPISSKITNKQKMKQHKPKSLQQEHESSHLQSEDVLKCKKSLEKEGQLTNILENLKNTEDYGGEDESFFITLFKRNMQHFRKGGEFSDLIDFGKNVIQNQDTCPRKPSGLDGNDGESIK